MKIKDIARAPAENETSGLKQIELVNDKVERRKLQVQEKNRLIVLSVAKDYESMKPFATDMIHGALCHRRTTHVTR